MGEIGAGAGGEGGEIFWVVRGEKWRGVGMIEKDE